jgi:outer membrane protein OmpA-like peptidoglycan-associated protein
MRCFGFILSCMLLAACAHDKASSKDQTNERESAALTGAAPATAMAAATGAASVKTHEPAAPSGCSLDENCDVKQLCIRKVCTDIVSSLAECAAVRVHFEKDSTELSQDTRQSLMRVSRCLKNDQKLTVSIAGNADNSGSQGYNRELGDRRANSVADFLLAQGVSQNQLRAISFGEELPLCWTQNEECMAKNRRVAIKPLPQRKKVDIAVLRKSTNPM